MSTTQKNKSSFQSGSNDQVGSHNIVRHSYNKVLDACARLSAFSTCTPSETCAVAEQQEILARDDLVTFAIHARRLIDNTGFRKEAGKVQIRSVILSPKPRQSFRRIINVVIHHAEIQIIRFNYQLKILSGNWDVEDLLTKNVRHFNPFVAVVSEESEYISFDLRELVNDFEKKILNPIIKICVNDRLFLEDL